MSENFLVKTLKYFIYAAAFMPLIIFSDFISPFHFGKVVVFRSMVELMLAFYLVLIWRFPEYRPRLTKIGWAFFFFVLAFTITTVTSVIPYASFWGSLERMGGLFTFWHYFIFFLMLTSIFRTEKDWLNLLDLTIVISILSSFYGFLQRTDASFIVGSGDRLRIFGTIGNPALFAGYEILGMFLALMLFLKPDNSGNRKLFYGSAVLINTLAILMTAVRGSIMGIAVGFVLFALLYSVGFKSKRARKYLLGLLMLLIVFVGLAMMLKNTEFVRNSGYLTRLSDFSLTTYTVQTRFWAWQAGFKGWSEGIKTIVFGWGPENFNIPFAKYFNPKFFNGPGSETLFDRAHNMFIEILVTMGLLGFLTYVWIFGASLKALWKKLNEKQNVLYGVGLIPLIFAYAIHNMFIFDTSANFLVFFTILGFVSYLSVQGGADKKVEAKNNHSFKRWGGKGDPAMVLVLIVSLVLMIIAVYYINVRPSKANYATTRAILRSWAKDEAGAIKKFQEALSYNTPGKYEYRHRFAQYVLEKTNSATLTPELEQVLLLASEEVKKNIDENKPDYLPLLYSSRIFIILGRTDPASPYNDKALEMSGEALKLSPTFVRTYYEVGQAYLNKKDYDKASENFRKATELNPDVGLSWWYLGVVEIERGNTKEGLAILEDIIFSRKIYTPNESDLNRMINIYASSNNFAKLALVYDTLTTAKPDNAQYHASYAVVLAQLGKLDQAVAEAKLAAKVNKDFEAEARSFVQSLGRSW